MNVPGVRKDGAGLRVNDRAVYISAAGVLIPVMVAAIGLYVQFRGMQADMARFQEQWNTQAIDRAQYRRDVDTRLRALEQDRTTAIAELASLRRDLTEFRVEMRSDLQAIAEVLQRVYRNGNGQTP
jgi:hypothetical protein